MNRLKNLFVPFLSAALLFSSGPIFAQNFVNTIPGFYYLEDARDGFFSVRACSTSSAEGDSVKALDCPIVAEVSTSDLENFLADFSREAEDDYNHTKSHSTKLKFTFLGLSGAGALGMVFAVLKLPASSMAYKLSWPINLLAVLGGFSGSNYYGRQSTQNRNNYKAQQTFEQQTRIGLVGPFPYNRNVSLQKFTDFVNQYGVRPTPEAAAIASN